ncbi:MAG: hypothetical protein H9W81_07300 [Enterococcus sp.]|nr:hypothetical protein [Enterococcus sp.]
MSLPPISRPSGGLPPRNNSALPTGRRAVPAPEPAQEESTSEVLVITVGPDTEDPTNLAVIFEGAGFDIENDNIILDILDLAARTYGYKLVQEEDDE